MRLPATPPNWWEILRGLSDNPDRLAEILGAAGSTASGRYLHWDDIRHRGPPGDLSPAEWWLAHKWSRQAQMRTLPLRDADGRPFQYSLPDRLLALLHIVDQRASGEIVLSETVTDEGTRRRYLIDSLMEEAIASSQIEGASTTRKVAKEMLRTGRRPRDISEQMIANNYRAIMRITETKDETVTPGAILDLHRILTEGTLENPEAAGRLQRPDEERVRVVDPADDTVLHVPPPAEQLPERLDAICAFANADDQEPFIHPVIRAVIVHLWLAYDHPFEDGNGRTARALFYWVMASKGYWLTEYLSISRLLNRARAQYRRSFLLTETDDLDATYFLIYQLEVIVRAIEELHEYLRRRMHELRETEELLRRSDINYRQLALLGHALRHPDADYTYQSHARSHRVARQSARKDLLSLADLGLLTATRVWRATHFRPARDLSDRISSQSAPAVQ
jgi:Fic family protein